MASAMKRELSDIPLDRLAQYQQAALMRLLLKLTGETHRLLNEYINKLRARLLDSASEEGKLDSLNFLGLTNYASDTWRTTFAAWQKIFEAARWEAAAIPLGSLARLHGYFVGAAALSESRRGFAEQGPKVGVRGEPFFKPQLQAVVDAANERIYGDGFKLSGRIWKLDADSLAGIQRTLQRGLATGNSAWNIAKELEQYLGPGADCPRWTRTRLYKLTKSEIAAGDERGLIRGNPCESKGVAYNALRLARNEVQVVHARATDALMKQQPWVQAERIRLSPSHPAIGCACEDVVAGGEKGDGVYPVGTVSLPIHVHCLCHKEAVLMPQDEFVQKMRGWMRGEAAWPEMDDYAASLGVMGSGVAAVMLGAAAAETMTRWLWGSEEEQGEALEIREVPPEEETGTEG